LNVSILNLSRKLRVGLSAEVSYCRIMCTHGVSYLFLVPCVFLFSIDNYSFVILAADSCTCMLASNRFHRSQRNTLGAHVGTLTVDGAVTEVGLQIVDHVTSTSSTLVLTQRHQGQVNQLGTGEQVRCTVWASCDTRATANAGGVVQSKLCGLVV